MAQSLVIVESPAKARTINRYLGKGYVVKSSVGHIRDLPAGGGDGKGAAKKKAGGLSSEGRAANRAQLARQQLIRRMGVDPDDGWKAHYEVLPGKEKVVEDLSKLAAKADAVYLATDLDREGEAIAWHLREAIGGTPQRYRRVVFNEITRKAIQDAFSTPAELDMNRVNAQQARRFLDRVVGFEVSPLLWAKIARGLSAGRVQSVAVRLVVEREREIRAFTPEEYWELFADLKRAGEADAVRFQVVKDGGQDFRPGNEATAQEALDRLRQIGRDGVFTVSARKDRPTKTRPNPPFITSTLQQAASARLGYGVKKTMGLAQRLYEAGHITYMRTDSTNLSGEAVAACRRHIGDQYGNKYLPDKPRFYASKASAQEAHEAIRPSNVGKAAEQLAGVNAEAMRLYDLIRRQFIACQMPDAAYLATTVLATGGGFELRVRGRIQLFDGHTRVLPPAARGDEDKPLSEGLAVGEALVFADAEAVQHFTKPPPRYGEASLVRELEKRGIGRPSTYAAIISTIQERGYVMLVKRRFHAEKIGELVNDRLVEQFQDLMDYGFTAKLERELDQIATGKARWRSVLDTFYRDFSTNLANARRSDGGMRPNLPTDTDVACPKCGRPMQIRTAGTGVFLGCSGYRLPPKERCQGTLNLVPGEDAATAEDDEGESRLLRSKRKCPLCSLPMNGYLVDAERKLHICGNNPECPGFEVEQGRFRIKGYEGPVIECDRCGADMQLKSGRFGKYFGCMACKNTRKLLRNGQPAPPKADPVPMPELRCQTVDDYYLLRDGASGIFLAASQFPKNRETRPPKVAELLPHANELDPKFKYLLAAPTTDPDGLPTVIRFSRKTKQQYVQSEQDGKPTGWQAFHRGGKWVEGKAAPTRKPAVKSGRAGKRTK